MFSVELLPDPRIDRAVRSDWERLREAHLPSAGRNPSPSNRPHLTAAVREHVDPAALEDLVELLPLPLEVSGVVLFGRERFVLARHVVVAGALAAFHAAVARRLGPPGARFETTAVDRWTPHLTLARGLDADHLARALRAVEIPNMVGEAVGLRVWDAAAKAVTTLR
ncbi:2'-5' RNA ligase family protein [Microbacterium hominis]|uniref:2'-5' RNA ligase family protein n=1 Tax=Microbacterium hominis TaxID=162426 RepID=A0A7D4PT96_9MICO|nr:2'-5' RNA ligase family protein [Microbacterium hominis]QKJ18653.1 2'-5' RNA ligase family protein [Microbacterium hominis]